MPLTVTRRWVRADQPNASPRPDMRAAILRGLAGHCPNCGRAPIFRGYLRVVPTCANCGVPLGQLRADDAPPYITLLVVCHIVVGLLLAVERAFSPSTGLEVAIFLPLTALLIMGLLRPVKGATVGVMLALGMLPADA
jgi:uncharacterized protein (DUF983 family)